MKERKQNFIRKIQIKNYKSIKDLTIEFHAGLNIIIGPNGTGKTNFVNAVNSVFTERLHADLPIGFEFRFEFVNEEEEVVTYTGAVQEAIFTNGVNVRLKNRVYSATVTYTTDIITDDALLSSNILNFLYKNGIYPNYLKLISFGYPTQLPYVNKLEQIRLVLAFSQTNRVGWIAKIGANAYFGFESIEMPSKVTLRMVKKILKIDPSLVKNLAHFSPIKDCRISDGYTIQKMDRELQINHILLEFFVNDEWVSWEYLSDGTKRLFYVISETLADFRLGGFVARSSFLIEEPELGIHPDQLYKLMDFLKEQSQHKQIIITTHSPDVLNILETNELHKIVVTRIDKQQGTLMHHLSPQKVKKAQSYMEDLSLKDFWVHSNLEALDETAEN